MKIDVNFVEEVKRIENYFDGSCIGNIGQLKAEIVVETLKDWSFKGGLSDLKDWFISNQKTCQMKLEEIPLLECKGWSIEGSSGRLVHESGDFFYLQGIRVHNTSVREVRTGWDQPILTQVGFNGGILGLVRTKINQIPHYLIEAKAEPGNPDLVQICPTLQATFSNLNRAHGGLKPRYSEFFEEKGRGKVLFEQWMSEDGGRLNLKRNKGMIVEVKSEEDVGDLPLNFRWVSLYQLKKLIKENSWVSPHIRGLISHL